MDYARNAKYFTKSTGKVQLIIIVIGIIYAIAMAGESGANLFGGILIAAIGVGWLVIKAKGTPSDAEIDSQVESMLDSLKQKALSKHGLVEEQVQEAEPIILGGYLTENVASIISTAMSGNIKSAAKQVGKHLDSVVKTASAFANDNTASIAKTGKDGVLRTADCEWTIFLFGTDEVFSYTEQFSLTSPGKRENSNEYFYKDIVSVNTDKDANGFQHFKMTTTGGDSIELPMNMSSNSTMDSISKMRQLIRNKKTQ